MFLNKPHKYKIEKCSKTFVQTYFCVSQKIPNISCNYPTNDFHVFREKRNRYPLITWNSNFSKKNLWQQISCSYDFVSEVSRSINTFEVYKKFEKCGEILECNQSFSRPFRIRISSSATVNETWQNFLTKGKEKLEQLPCEQFRQCFKISRAFLRAKQVGQKRGKFQTL